MATQVNIPSVQLHAFGEVFPLPRNKLIQSEVLSTALSGQFKEQDEVNLELDPEYYFGFLVVYNYLLDPNQNLPEMDLDVLIQTLALADYFVIPTLFDKLVEMMREGGYSFSELVPIYIQFAYLPIISKMGRAAFSKVKSWNKLSSRTQSLLQPLFGQDLSANPKYPIGLRVQRITYDTKSILNLMPAGWAAKCQKGNRPEVIEDFKHLPIYIGQSKAIANIGGSYITCPGGKQLRTENIKGQLLPCCGTSTNLPLLDPKFSKLKAIKADNGYLALVDPKFSGDFILIWNPLIDDDLRIIVDQDAL